MSVAELGKGQMKALYDDSELFAAYEKMRMLDGRLNEIVEAPALISLMPEIAGMAVADLGCGTGVMCRWLVDQGAASVVGIDASEQMLSRAREQNTDVGRLRFEQKDIEGVDFAPASFNLVISGLALHYVADFAGVAHRVSQALRPGGCFIFSVEHPIVTCGQREWVHDENGTRRHWPVDRYLDEGSRSVLWMGLAEVPRQHRSVSSYVNGVLGAGLVFRSLLEPGPDEKAIATWPRLNDQRRRPPFLVIRADKPTQA